MTLQHYTFYDFIINKARGKSGPLFNFDVHDDVRLLADATKEKDESHAGKVVERSYYQRNKHIFPASRWEVRRSPSSVFILFLIFSRSSILRKAMASIHCITFVLFVSQLLEPQFIRISFISLHRCQEDEPMFLLGTQDFASWPSPVVSARVASVLLNI